MANLFCITLLLTFEEYEQSVEHYENAFSKKWNQKYHVDTRYHKVEGPVLMYLLDYDPCKPTDRIPTNLYKLAKQIYAAIVMVRMRGTDYEVMAEIPRLPITIENQQEDLLSLRELLKSKLKTEQFILVGATRFQTFVQQTQVTYKAKFVAAISIKTKNCFEKAVQVIDSPRLIFNQFQLEPFCTSGSKEDLRHLVDRKFLDPDNLETSLICNTYQLHNSKVAAFCTSQFSYWRSLKGAQ